MVIITGPGGTIDPGGAVVVHGGDDQVFTMVPEGVAPGASFVGVGDPGDWSGTTIMMDRWEAHTFTPTLEFEATQVSLPMMKSATGDPGTVHVYIRATDIDGHPTGSDLAEGSFAGSDLGSVAFGWNTVPFVESVVLHAGEKYAVIVCAPDSGESAFVVWAYEEGNGYPTGNPEESVNGGVSFTVPYEGIDDHDHPFTFDTGSGYYYVEGIYVDDVCVDPTAYEVGEVVTYTFHAVAADHTIQVHFSEAYLE